MDDLSALTMHTEIVFVTAQLWDVPVMEVAEFYAAYGRKVKQGAAAFWPWYQAQRARFEAGTLLFEPLYPHDVFPDLPEWFYQEVAVAS